MQALTELLFQLASTDRLTLLSMLKAERMRLTQLAEKIAATVQETSRHLARLSQAGLIQKDAAGLYGLSSLGRLALNLLSSFDFLAKNREYFQTHDLSPLPSEFLHRIGELSDYEFGGHIGDILRHTERVITDAREYVWLMADQPIPMKVDHALRSQVSVRVIIPAKSVPPGEHGPRTNKQIGTLELGLVEEAPVGIAMNERLAGISLPDLRGKIDFSAGFRGSNAHFHGWCRDLFNFYWNKAKKLTWNLAAQD